MCVNSAETKSWVDGLQTEPIDVRHAEPRDGVEGVQDVGRAAGQLGEASDNFVLAPANNERIK